MEALKHKADMPVSDICQRVVGKVFEILAIQQILPGGGYIQAAHQVHQRGLAAAGGAHNGQIVPSFHGQIDILQHSYRFLSLIIVLTNVRHCDNGHHSTPLSMLAEAGSTRVVGAPSTQSSGSGKAM